MLEVYQKVSNVNANLSKSRDVYVKVLSIGLLTLGSSLFVTFFSMVEEGISIYVIMISVILLSLSAFLAIISLREKSANLHFIFILYVTTLCLFLMYRIRFQVLTGSDILFEYRTARVTFEQVVWSLSRSPLERYFSAISISLVPPVLSEISGLNLLTIFRYVYPMITSTLPILLFLTVKEAFQKPKLAGVTAVLFTQLLFNFTLLMSLVRQQVAEMFLLLAFFVAFKLQSDKFDKRSKGPLIVLLIIFMFGIVSSHYSVNYFSMAIFSSAFLFGLLLPRLPRKFRDFLRIDRKSKRLTVDLQRLIFFFALSFAWIISVYPTNFMRDMQNQLTAITSPVLKPQYEVRFILSGAPTAGILITAWLDLIAALSAVGFVWMVLTSRKDSKRISWMSAGFIMLGITSLWMIPSISSSGVFIDRVFTIGAIFFTSFVAFAVLKVDRRLRYKGVAFVLLFFLLLNLPMNMLLPSHFRYLLYHKGDVVAPDVSILQGLPRLSEFEMATWADQHIPANNTFLVNMMGANSIFYVHGQIWESLSPYSKMGDYLVLNHYNLQYNIWRTSALDSEKINATDLMDKGGVIYNNGEAALVSQK